MDLRKELNGILKVKKDVIDGDIRASEYINDFHIRTNKKYYTPGEEHSDIYPRLLRITEALSKEVQDSHDEIGYF